MATMRIGGLSSGTDYAGMVEQLMNARRVPITLKENKQTEVDYDLGAWSHVQSLASDLTKSLDSLRGFDLWNSMSVGSSVETVATATASTAAVEQDYTLAITQLARSHTVASDQLVTTNDLITDGYVNENDVFDIEGQQITIEAGETLTSLASKINSAALLMDEDDRVSASIVDSRLVLTREKTGSTSITISDVTGTPLQGLGILTSPGVFKNQTQTGLNAEFTINGLDVVRSDNTGLTDVVDGLTINLLTEGSSTVLSVEPDRTDARAAILDFIEKYNTLAETLDDYNKIELGGSANLAQKGELYGDSLVSSIETNMRRLASDVKGPDLNAINAGYTYEGNDGIMDSLGDIGIWTTGEQNRLELTDETKLDYMLENEFDNVTQLFRGTYDDVEIAYTNGVASDFYSYADRISSSLTGDIAKRIEALTEDYDDYADEIKEMNTDLEDYEVDLWDQFTLMEDALANMKSQLDYISAVFGSK